MFLHVLSDTLGSVGVIISTLLTKWYGKFTGPIFAGKLSKNAEFHKPNRTLVRSIDNRLVMGRSPLLSFHRSHDDRECVAFIEADWRGIVTTCTVWVGG